MPSTTENLPDLAGMAAKIVAAFQPEKILLFGSRARGQAHAESDVDLCVVMQSTLPPMQRAAVVLALFHPRRWPLDIIVYTPEETQRLAGSSSSLWNAILREGKVLHG